MASERTPSSSPSGAELDIYVSVPSAARRLDISTSTAWAYIRAGLLPAPVKLGPNTTRLSWRRVQEHMDRQQAQADAEALDAKTYKACHRARAKRRATSSSSSCVQGTPSVNDDGRSLPESVEPVSDDRG